MSDRLFGSKLPYSIPPLHIAEHQFSNLISRDNKLSVNLNEIASHIMSGKAVFRSALAAIMMDTYPLSGTFSWSLPHIVS